MGAEEDWLDEMKPPIGAPSLSSGWAPKRIDWTSGAMPAYRRLSGGAPEVIAERRQPCRVDGGMSAARAHDAQVTPVGIKSLTTETMKRWIAVRCSPGPNA